MKDYRNQIIIHDLEAMEVMEGKCNIMGTFIQGSQNYMLDYEGSDVDSISLAVPSFKSLCLEEQKFSFTHVRQNNEHIDIKDFRLIFGSWLKQNVKYLEILFSKYHTIDERYRVVWDSITENREKISRYDQIRGVKCCFGMAMEKYKALKHPYPSIIEKIEKHGYDCYSEDTLFLTSSGTWKHFDEISDNDLLATMNPTTRVLEFQPIRSRIKKPCITIYNVETNNTKFKITGQHNIFTSRISNINKNGHTYRDTPWEMETLERHLSSRGKHCHVMPFPLNGNKEYPVEDSMLKAVGGFVSEGSINFRDKEQTIVKAARITQTARGKPDFYTMMDSTDWKRYDYQKETVWIANKTAATHLYEWCGHGSKQKTLPYWFVSLSQRQANILLEALILGDGSYYTCRDTYYTSSKALADQVLILAFLAGKKAVVFGGEAGYKTNGNFGEVQMYHVSIKAGDSLEEYVYLKEGKNLSKEEYNGEVVCFEVENGLLVTKLDGKCAVQGNCKQLHHIVRLSQFIEDFYIEGKTFEESLIPYDQEYLISLKTNAMPLELAEKVAMSHIRLIEDMRREVEEKYKDHKVDEEVEELLNEATVDIFMETFDVR